MDTNASHHQGTAHTGHVTNSPWTQPAFPGLDITQPACAEPGPINGLGTPTPPPHTTSDADLFQGYHDVPAFATNNLNRAAAAVDYWIGQHAVDRRRDDADCASNARSISPAMVAADLHMFVPTRDLGFADDMALDAAVREVLDLTVAEIHALAPSDRGHYLAQVLTRRFSDREMDWSRFRLGHLLAQYYSMMPTRAVSLGVVDDSERALILGWETAQGVYLDVVHSGRPPVDHIEDYIQTAIQAGQERWPTTFVGVRYLPLNHLDPARLYDPDGTCAAVMQHSLLGALR